MKNFVIAASALILAGSFVGVAAADPPGWDNQNNGYYIGNTWHYGQPSARIMNRHGFRAGYRNWRRGQRLPVAYHHRYQEVDYRTEHLRAPRRGYHYVRDDHGDVLLVAITTGLIASIIAHH